jgi:hypothetical protein
MSPSDEPFTVQVLDDWTRKQGLAVYELPHELAGTVWDRYGMLLIELLAPPCNDRDPA